MLNENIQNQKVPALSVIMPVYNTEKYLQESLESILNQSFQDFELIIINDGSKDNSLKIINKYAENPEYQNKIKIINQKNTGVIQALNNGIKISTGKYIARMDADDISTPNRFARQIEILEKEKVAMCGSWAIIIDENGREIGKMNYPKTNWWKNKLYIIRRNPFIHPSVMIRKDILEKVSHNHNYYQKNYKYVEDYELWTRIIFKYQAINLPEYLLKYRIHPQQITQKDNLKMRINGILVRFLAIWRLVLSCFRSD